MRHCESTRLIPSVGVGVDGLEAKVFFCLGHQLGDNG